MKEEPANKPESLVSFPIRLKFAVAQILLGFLPLILITAFLFVQYETVTQDALQLAERSGFETISIEKNLTALRLSGGFLFGFFIVLIGAGTFISLRLLTGPLIKLVGWIRVAHQKKFVGIADAPIISSDEVGQLTYEINEAIKYFRETGEREKAISKAKSEFISIAAHQLRTPLTSIRWALSALAANEAKDQADKRLAEVGLASAERMINLVNDLLSVNNIEEGRFGFSFRKVDLNPLLEQSVNELHPLAEARQISIRIVNSSSQNIVYIDPDRIGLVLSNLLSNAINYTSPGGNVTIRTSHKGEKIEVAIEDTGIGMTPEEQKQLFSKFFRAKEAIRLHPDGSGLGLFIVKNIISRHSGTVEVKSEPQKGSIFTFTLPTKEIERKEVPFEQFFSSF